jgi:hypothetical protein
MYTLTASLSVIRSDVNGTATLVKYRSVIVPFVIDSGTAELFAIVVNVAPLYFNISI